MVAPPTLQQESTSSTNDWNASMLDDPSSELGNKENTHKRTGMENWQIDNASSVVSDDNNDRTASNNTTGEPHKNPKNTWTTINNGHTKTHPNVNSDILNSASIGPSSHQSRTSMITDFMPTSSLIPKKRAVEDNATVASNVRDSTPQMNQSPNHQVHKQPRIHSPAPSNAVLQTPTVSSMQTKNAQTLLETHINLPRSTDTASRQKQPDLSLRSSTIQALKKPHPKVTENNSRTLKAPNIQQLCNTFNQSMMVDCNIEDIKAAYPQRKEILSESYRIRIQDYMVMNDYDQTGQVTKLLKSPPGLEKHGLSFYTRGNPSIIDKHRHQICQLGVVKLKPLYINAIVSRLSKEYKLNCTKILDRPVQILFDPQDKLFPILLGLKSKEQLVDDDLHGQKKITYSEIVDETVVSNGFRVRWRKGKLYIKTWSLCIYFNMQIDLYSGNLVVQFTGIYSLGSGYGTSDFRELLSMMAGRRKGEFVRPKKVMGHLKSIAEEIYNNSKQSTDYVMRDIEKGLESLSWVKGDNAWDLGRSKIQDEVLACTINSSNI